MTTPLTPQDGAVTLPQDRDLGAMVAAIEAEAHFSLMDAESPFHLRRRLAVIQGAAERLAVALEREQGVLRDMAKGLTEMLGHEVVRFDEYWKAGDTALAKYKEARP